MTTTLSTYFRVQRRYARSVNLERDLDIAGCVEGYVPTGTGLGLLERILTAEHTEHSARAWTITGVYGTGKSAFAHFLAVLHGMKGDRARAGAVATLKCDRDGRRLLSAVQALPESGLVRAVVTGRREPITQTVLRALLRGGEEFWARKPGRNPAVLDQIRRLLKKAARAELDGGAVVQVASDLAAASNAGVLLILDELGKPLERAAERGSASDLYLLQQLAELPVSGKVPPVLLVGILHQSFLDYGRGLSVAERSEWDKIHGRFEDISFAESPDQMLQLIGRAIQSNAPKAASQKMKRLSKAWRSHLTSVSRHPYISDVLTSERIQEVLPLHPITALVLPSLCAKYAQNDRSLFTFLTSEENHSFSRFLAEHSFGKGEGAGDLPLLRLAKVYDYFVDVGGVNLSARPQFQRWAEIHTTLRDAHGLPTDQLEALKTIGTLNLVTSTGALRASRELVIAALSDEPRDEEELTKWSEVVDDLVRRGLVTYRSQMDELRLWQGSEFNVEEALRTRVEAERRSLGDLLTAHVPLSPVIAERHSYRTGTLRAFERRYAESKRSLSKVATESVHSDGVIIYWLGKEEPQKVPSRTTDGRPLVLLVSSDLAPLFSAAHELAALTEIQRLEGALRTDSVAKREVEYRLSLAQKHLDDRLREAFDLRGRNDVGHPSARCWMVGKAWSGTNFNAALSAICDRAYGLGPTLWNELLNRRELTSQGARAQRELIEALVSNTTEARLGLDGYGPEVSMYESVFRASGIHRPNKATFWEIGPPQEDSGLQGVWMAVEEFFDNSTEMPRSLAELYSLLTRPPFGVKEGLLPVVVAAVLVYRSDDVSLYREGTFIPQLGPEHFEVLVKQPSKFAVKHFELRGIRWELFRDLESVLVNAATRKPAKKRNATLLSVVRPLVRFASQLPRVTLNTNRLSREALAVRNALTNATEPDRLIFETLPDACGFEPFLAVPRRRDSSGATARHVEFRKTLLEKLRELQTHYDQLLDRCREQIGEALVPGEAPAREHLRARAQVLVDKCLEPGLRRFLIAAADGEAADRDWIQALAMVTTDRPPENWSDDDLLGFEANLSELSRRFLHLESLHLGSIRQGRDAFEARRVTITRPDGSEIHELIWLDRGERDLVNHHLEQLLSGLEDVQNEHQRNAVALALVERLLKSVKQDQTSDAKSEEEVTVKRKRRQKHV